MIRTVDDHNQNKNLTMLHSENRTKGVCHTGQNMDTVIETSTSIYFSSETVMKILK